MMKKVKQASTLISNVYDWNAIKRKCDDGVQLFEKRGQVGAQVRRLLHCVRQRGGRTS
jgi:hypothetical protein